MNKWRVSTFVLAALALSGAFAAGYNIFQPGGDLTGTWNSQTIANSAVTNAKIANSTIDLTAKVTGVLPAANGGAGVATLTGVAKGNGTSAFTTAVSSDIRGLWTGTCDATTFLRGDGACAAGNSGTVTSVALTVPSGFSVTGSPITSSGTLAVSGTLNPSAGGTGVATLTGVAKGNGTSAFTVAVSSDIIGLWSGTCDNTAYLRGDGACTTTPAGANPSASAGLTAVNGSATTFLRSDGAPAISQAIIPTWTGIHTWSLAEPRLLLSESDQGSNLKVWDFDLNGSVLTGRTRTDADGAGKNWLSVTRGTTTAISNISFGNATDNNTTTFLGSGAISVTTLNGTSVTGSSLVSAGRLQVTASSIPNVGLYLPGTNRLGFGTNTTLRGEFDANGAFITQGAILSGGTKFTASGCSNSTTVGGATAGKFTSGTTGTCAVTITLPTATNGWTCYASDMTTPVVFTQTANTTTSCTVSATTVTNDIVTFMAMGY